MILDPVLSVEGALTLWIGRACVGLNVWGNEGHVGTTSSFYSYTTSFYFLTSPASARVTATACATIVAASSATWHHLLVVCQINTLRLLIHFIPTTAYVPIDPSVSLVHRLLFWLLIAILFPPFYSLPNTVPLISFAGRLNTPYIVRELQAWDTETVNNSSIRSVLCFLKAIMEIYSPRTQGLISIGPLASSVPPASGCIICSKTITNDTKFDEDMEHG